MASMMIIVKACFSNIRSGRLRAFAFARLVSQNIRSGRLSAFAFARLESICCFYPWMSETFLLYFSISLLLHFSIVHISLNLNCLLLKVGARYCLLDTNSNGTHVCATPKTSVDRSFFVLSYEVKSQGLFLKIFAVAAL
uniref:Uncharacterized protein n=1 Tax=Solanum lycopersicum TaxID=4081 RepID=K4BS99_SOLLC